jgi:hypothetical protein
MAAKPGRPPMRAYGVWRSSDVVERRVCKVLAQRDPDNEETITNAVYGVRRVARRILAKQDWTPERIRQLSTMAVSSEPSEVFRLLQSWRFRLPDRTARRLHARTDIAEIRWA